MQLSVKSPTDLPRYKRQVERQLLALHQQPDCFLYQEQIQLKAIYQAVLAVLDSAIRRHIKSGALTINDLLQNG